jgi:hypothetical protein
MPNLFVFNHQIKSDSYAFKQKVCRTLLVTDMRIVFKNDKNRDKNDKKIEYRMITFTAMGEF